MGLNIISVARYTCVVPKLLLGHVTSTMELRVSSCSAHSVFSLRTFKFWLLVSSFLDAKANFTNKIMDIEDLVTMGKKFK